MVQILFAYLAQKKHEKKVIFWKPNVCKFQFGPGNLQCKIFGACRPEERRCIG